MPDQSIIFQRATFTYSQSSYAIVENLSVQFPKGWTGIVGANGVGKSTILQLATGILEPQEGRVYVPDLAIYCPQRTDEAPPEFGNLLQATDRLAFKVKEKLGIKEEWFDRWDSLSHGERKRVQIAVALWREPEVLALDEPTNHLDDDARAMLIGALRSFNGIGILVSHDREMLDMLCSQCLFIDPPDTDLRPGNYSQGLEQAEIEVKTAHRNRSDAKLEYERLQAEASKRRDEASQAHRKRSRRGLAIGDHDTREKIGRARATGKDGYAGKQLRQLEGRISQAQTEVEQNRTKKTYSLGIWMEGAVSPRNTLFSLEGGVLPLGENRELEFPDLIMLPDDRIALKGANGSGKSTLVRRILENLNLDRNKLTYIPQEIDIQSSQGILNRARQLPREQLGQLMTIVSCLGSRPQRLLESENPSPGEIRKLLLAIGILETPHLIIMDEPTNHLDLPSIECLEEALSECPCGLLLISHDERFLRALTSAEWVIREESQGRNVLKLGRQQSVVS